MPNSTPIKILVTDDHAVLREGIMRILATRLENVSFGEASNATEALEKAWEEKWHLILLDITMPGRSGLDILQQLRQAQPDTPILVLSMHSEDQFAVRVLRAGAAGYLTKNSDPNELVSAVQKILGGGHYISSSLGEKLAASLRHNIQPPQELLSDREFQVMRMIASGKTLKEIAAELSLSVKTISTYRTRILEKMEMRTNAELMHYAIEHGLA
jgi:DNA-binding NarL/FixJ family response regulator